MQLVHLDVIAGYTLVTRVNMHFISMCLALFHQKEYSSNKCLFLPKKNYGVVKRTGKYFRESTHLNGRKDNK